MTPSPTVPPIDEVLKTAIEATAREDGGSPLLGVGATISKTHPSFDSRNYGYSKLGDLVREQDYLEVNEVRASDGSNTAALYVRLKRARAGVAKDVPRAARS